jgi:hypothetical protein
LAHLPTAELLQRLAHLLSFGYFSFDSVGWDLQSNVRRRWLIDYGVSNTKETNKFWWINQQTIENFKKPAFTWLCSRWTLIYRLHCRLFFSPIKKCVSSSPVSRFFWHFLLMLTLKHFSCHFRKK